MQQTTRISTIQCTQDPSPHGTKTNPFSDDFSIEALFDSMDRRIGLAEELFAEAAAQGCRLTVTTEDLTRISATATYLDDPSIFRRAVERQTALVPERVGASARRHGLYIVVCYYAAEKDAIVNVADLFGPDGEIAGRYRKVHLPQYEKWLVSAGGTFPAFETDLGWIGLLICYDQMWPEATSCCAMNGAQLICQPTAASPAEYRMRTRAMDNQVHCLSSTSVHSMIVSPRGEVMADAGDSERAVAWADVDLNGSTVADAHYWEYLYSGIRDHKERHLKLRRPDAYRVLSDPCPPLAAQYPEGGLAESEEDRQRVYEEHKAMQKRALRGEPIPYHWRW